MELFNSKIENKVRSATKWSTLGEGIARLISPITNMILARLLLPETFGIVATITMITSFADVFTDAGFQKYIIQHEFETEREYNNSVNVAFWSNMGLSICLWLFILIFCKPLAKLVGNSGYELEMIIACLQLPITSFSSIQRAIYRRNFDFKSLSFVRVITACIPLVVTVPFAMIGMGCWALIIGNLMRVIIYALFLSKKSKWKPQLFYSFSILKSMLSFSFFTLVESILIWLNNWIDIFIIGSAFSAYYLGIYKNAQQLVNAVTSLITAIIVPILFSALSRLQDDEVEFERFFFKIQKISAYFVLPLGIGFFIFRDLAVYIMLGDGWAESSNIIGVWAITSCILIVCSNFYLEVYRAKGKPELSVITQVINLGLLIPACIFSSTMGFWTLVYTRAGMRMVNVLTGTIIMTVILHFKFRDILKNLIKPIMLSAEMGLIAILGKYICTTFMSQIVLIIICILFYLLSIRVVAKKDWEKIITFIIRKDRK